MTWFVLLLMSQLFARKLIRPYGSSTIEDLQNEIRVIEKLSERANIRNVVRILRHGFLQPIRYYHIDMELGDLNLNDYIQGALPNSAPPESPYFNRDMINFFHVWRVMKDIVEGLDVIHELGEVHRDLKPRNGMYFVGSIKWES